MTLRQIELLSVAALLILGPAGYWKFETGVFTATVGESIRIVLLISLLVRLVLSRRIVISGYRMARFWSWVVGVTVISAIICVANPEGLRGSRTDVVVRATVQLIEMSSWVATFYCATRLGKYAFERLSKVLLLGLIIHAVLGVLQYGLIIGVGGDAWIGSEVFRISVPGLGPVPRMTALSEEPRGFGGAMALLTTGGLFALFTTKIRPIWLYGATVLGLVCLMLSFSATAYGTAAVGLALLFVGEIYRKIKYGDLLVSTDVLVKGMLSISAIGIVVGIFLVLFPSPFSYTIERILGTFGFGETRPGIIAGRFSLFGLTSLSVGPHTAMVVALLRDNVWTLITGFGDGMATLLVQPYFNRYHSWLSAEYMGVVEATIGFVRIISDWGIVGLLLLSELFYSIYNDAVRHIRTSDWWPAYAVFISGTVVFFVSMLSHVITMNYIAIPGILAGYISDGRQMG